MIAQGPAAVANARLGDRLASIDGVPVRPALSVDSLLMGKVGRVVLSVVASASGAAGGAPREVVLRPVNPDAENQAREGVVVDLRNNNGGFVNVYAIDVLARRNYLNFTDRGTGVVTPARSGIGQRMLDRPTILVTKQQTLSDGEDFTEGYRTLGLGKVVGEPTAGWIIFTSNVTLLDGATSLRLPSTRVTDNSGKDMEMHPRPVDIPVVRPIGESYAGKDSQFDVAVQALMGAFPKRP